MAAIASIAPILSAAGSLFGALQKPATPPVYTPPPVQIPDTPEAPTLASTATVSSIQDTEQAKLDQRRRLAILSEGQQVNTLTTRFTPITKSTQQSTLLGE